MIKKALKAALLASALSAAVIASAPAFAAGKLTVSSPQDPGSWDPIDTFLVNWASVATNIFDGLIYRGPDLKIVPVWQRRGKNSTKANASASICVKV